MTTSLEVVRQGRRVSVIDNKLFQGDVLTAAARVRFIHPISLPDIQEPAGPILEPRKAAPLTGVSAPHGGPWMWDSFEVRLLEEGPVFWFRAVEPLLDSMTPLARVLAPADWTHGLGRPARPVLADPNINLQVSICRPPEGDYVGVRPKTTWTASGVGLGEGALLDQAGRFGRVMNSVALTPPPK